MQPDAIAHAHDAAAPEAEIVDSPTSPSGVAVSAMDEGADTEREALAEADAAAGQEPRGPGPSMARHRRRTVVSPIPSLLAASMSPSPSPRRPGAPSSKVSTSQLGQAIAQARATWSSGDLLAAYQEVESAVSAAIASGELSSTFFRREEPFLMQVYTAYLGDLDAAPMLNVPMEIWETQSPTLEARAILERVNGLRTLRDILRDTGLDVFAQLRTAAQLFSTGYIGWG